MIYDVMISPDGAQFFSLGETDDLEEAIYAFTQVVLAAQIDDETLVFKIEDSSGDIHRHVDLRVVTG